ncbi:MAG: gfo/Idh/MocA family oxidoreductase [Armatimonadia bacterium]|nr:gfo/Idh/MocA family oxidoreductase [Armatimonadia bacterium]
MSRIGFHGRLIDEPEVRAGFIGCGSHSYRNIYPTFHYAPVNLVATCDLDAGRAEAFASKLGAEASYTDYQEMLARDDLDAVFVVTGYDERGRPLYPPIALDCLAAGKSVWIEKPPAATSAELVEVRRAADGAGLVAMVGLKKMFFPANVKAKALMGEEGFGELGLAMLQYPQYIPPADEIRRYLGGERVDSVVGFLDHLCHPMSLMVYLLGMPASLHYERSHAGSGMATFTFASGAVASLAMTHGQATNGGMERTVLVGSAGGHIVVDNNVRVSFHRSPPLAYGASPSFYEGTVSDATSVWEPEFSLGQLYNKGLFLLGYYDEVNEFARCVLSGEPPTRGTLDQAIQVTRVFEAFAEGPGKTIPLTSSEGTDS